MPLRVSGKNLDIGEALRLHVLARVEQAVGKHFDGQVAGGVTITRDGSAYRADCQLHVGSGVSLQAEGRAHEPYASFEQAAERIEKRLRRYKRKLKDRKSGSSAPEPAAGAFLAEYTVFEAPAAEDDDIEIGADYSPLVIAENTKKVPTLSVADAVTELDLSGAPVLVFRHAGNERVNVVYRRADGNIGWIDPASPRNGSSPS